MILYFADRHLNILGQASTSLPGGLLLDKDNKIADVETGVSTFECRVAFDSKTRANVEAFTATGNYILRKHGLENDFFQITEREIDNNKQQVYIYAEDDGMDLLNEVVGAYEADKAYPIAHYVNKYAAGSGFEIGINEVPSLTRKLSWDGESTATERIASVATQFDGCEISYSFEIDGLHVVKKYINIHEKRGKDNGIQLRMNQDIGSIITTESIVNIATALQCTGGTPEEAENPITLKGYAYDDGDFYVDGSVLKSRKALEKWSRLLWKTEESQKAGGHITKQFSYDTTSQKTLCSRAITELKKLREMEVNYEVELSRLPDNVKIGDRVNIIDDAGELYLSTRILLLETSVADQESKATLGEHLIKSSGISQRVAELAEQFAKNSLSAARALNIARNAKANADAAQTQADAAVESAEKAQNAADEATTAADAATQTAQAAQTAADNAQAAVEVVEKSVESIETTVQNAQQAADNAHQAAQTATQKADEAKEAAENAAADASIAKESATTAQTTADSAIEKAEDAQGTAADAKTAAESASATAASAKADAEQAEKDVAALGADLTTLSNTMEADYTRKTEFTETTADLQSQITQNAAEITSTVARVTEIDETANNAAEQAQTAQNQAAAAQTKANQATADALAAQQAADDAATAATNAQNEANTAKAAAEAAQGIADKAEADLEAAKADLATVTSRVDATEEEIAAAQQAVNTAKAAADQAKADAASAATKATEAQTTASNAVTDAASAQAAANEAASQARLAQQTADAAKGDAAAAQAKADEAAESAAEAQRTAATAVTNASNAQAKANEAAQAATAAQNAADEADAKAAKAAADLSTAQQNLANVTSRVDATAEEVAAAQAAVETAQAAADKAKADAQAAQSTADTAKANAATAQTAANNAKTAADNAQQAAKEAQEAADKAQADVDSLAVRVTTAETNITQNAEQIKLAATKTEVAETLGGYYTKEQTDAAISVSADSVKAEVKRIDICGWNLLKDSAGPFELGSSLLQIFYFDIEPGETYTIGADMEAIAGSLADVTFGLYYSGGCSASCGDHMEDGRFIYTFTVPDGSTDSGVWFTVPNASTQAIIRNIKLEKGENATDWTPATDDVKGSADETQALVNSLEGRLTEAESKLILLADSISTLVRDSKGESQMVQDSTSSTWAFNTKEIDQAISDTAAGLGELEATLGGTKETVDALKATLDGFQDRVKITTYENEPCIILFDETEYKKIITNTRCLHIKTTNGVDEIVGVEDFETLRKKRVEVEEAQIGKWVWKQRANGNLCLIWESEVEE